MVSLVDQVAAVEIKPHQHQVEQERLVKVTMVVLELIRVLKFQVVAAVRAQ
jgi:hypothetical protein